MTDTSAPPPRAGALKRWSLRLGLGLGVLIVIGMALIGAAEHHTSQAHFCGTCHIMEPYYASWQADLHGGKLDVACVDCHYAPGERTTINAKLRGLSQVTSYFSGRYGATRPRAHVSNDSCLTAKCHGDLRFMETPIELGTVRFVHSKHLRLDQASLETVQKDLDDLSKTIRTAVGEEQFGKLEATANESGPHEARVDKLVSLARGAGMQVGRDELEKYSQLTHRRVRTAQLADIQCTNCHSYGGGKGEAADGGKGEHPTHHFSVNTTSCFTCHFNNEGFNTGTNSCLMCHKQLPAGEIIVHRELSPAEGQKLQAPELTAKTVKMDHKAILERNVGCASCHADVASEDSTVTRRDCERCHDLPEFFQEWKEPFTLDLVTHYHKVHIPQQRAKCLDCHSEIHHQLIREEDGQPEFLTSVMANCMQCHPKHHQEQLDLLRGVGSTSIPQSTPNLMFGSRTNCLGCHTELTKAHAGDVARATSSGCIACHGDRHAETFEKWKLGLEVVETDAVDAYLAAQRALDEGKDIPEQTRQKATELLSAAKADLDLIKRGNGIHNVTYAMEVLDSVTQRAQQVTAMLLEAGGTR
jgi:nitrate/TMAO reductase-like tetraheme cytochrome c subunit